MLHFPNRMLLLYCYLIALFGNVPKMFAFLSKYVNNLHQLLVERSTFGNNGSFLPSFAWHFLYLYKMWYLSRF